MIDFADLDAELASVNAKAGLQAKAKTLQRAAARRDSSAVAELGAVNHLLRAYSWRAIAVVAFYAEQHCKCGGRHTIFLQFMMEEESLVGAKTRRYSKLLYSPEGLTHKAIKQVSKTTFCPSCAYPDFSPSDAEVKLTGNICVPVMEIDDATA